MGSESAGVQYRTLCEAGSSVTKVAASLIMRTLGSMCGSKTLLQVKIDF